MGRVPPAPHHSSAKFTSFVTDSQASIEADQSASFCRNAASTSWPSSTGLPAFPMSYWRQLASPFQWRRVREQSRRAASEV